MFLREGRPVLCLICPWSVLSLRPMVAILLGSPQRMVVLEGPMIRLIVVGTKAASLQGAF